MQQIVKQAKKKKKYNKICLSNLKKKIKFKNLIYI